MCIANSHIEGRILGRSGGFSALNSVAYGLCTQLTNELTGERTRDYTDKPGFVAAFTLAPEYAPAWMYDPVKLASYIDKKEPRRDSQLMREFVISMPIELETDQQQALAKELLETLFVSRGMIGMAFLHDEGLGNPHLHAMLTMRTLEEDGTFGNKCREWNEHTNILEWRKLWAEIVNKHLSQAGSDVRIDHRSCEEQGHGLLPIERLCRAEFEMEKRVNPKIQWETSVQFYGRFSLRFFSSSQFFRGSSKAKARLFFTARMRSLSPAELYRFRPCNEMIYRMSQKLITKKVALHRFDSECFITVAITASRRSMSWMAGLLPSLKITRLIYGGVSMKRWLILAVSLLIWGIALTACGSESQGTSSQGTSSQSSGAKEVHIVLTEMKIESDVTTFTHGVPYHFTIQNKGTVPHEFTITKVMKGDATEQQRDAASLKDMDHINPGQIQTLDYTFADAAPTGTLEFECAYPNHYQQGMHLGIVVE